MGMEQDWKNLGEQILDSVADALNSGDFSELNNLVSGTVNNVVQEAKKKADMEKLSGDELMEYLAKHHSINQEKWEKQQEELRSHQEERREQWRKRHLEQMQREYAQRDEERKKQRDRDQEGHNSRKAKDGKKGVPAVPFQKVGSVANVLNTVFGALGMGVCAAFAIVALVIILAGGSAGGWIFTSALCGLIFGSLMRKGSRQRGLLARAERYIKLCGTKMFADIADLAAQTGKSVRFVKKDIKKMLKCGMFPQGHLDEKETCFMLNDEVYRQYSETAAAFRMKEEMEKERIANENRPKTPQEQMEEARRQQERELNAMVSEGREYIRKLRELNEVIPGEEISGQLFRLEGLLNQIFDRVKEHPEQMGRMQKLMEYYLPTTIKLVEAYVEFEKVDLPGQDILDAKAEIYKTLGIINEAFVELLNNLFQDAAFDAATDAQVLRTMLAREGLRREMGAKTVGVENNQDGAQAEAAQTSYGTQAMETGQSQGTAVLKAPWEN